METYSNRVMERVEQLNHTANHMDFRHITLVASLRETFSNDNDHVKRECLDAIGIDAWAQFYHDNSYAHASLVSSLSNNAIHRLIEEAESTIFDRARFCRFVECEREEAARHPHAYFTSGEFGGTYGYFEPVRWNDNTKSFDSVDAFSEDQLEQLHEYLECCYYNGQPCGQYQREPHPNDEDCECILGREYSSLNLHELDEEEEKFYGVTTENIDHDPLSPDTTLV